MDDPFDLTCYVYPGWSPRIRAASSRRPWMDASPEAFAYRCLPLNIANAHGWELLAPRGFEAEWNGGPNVEDVVVRPDPGDGPPAVALFGQGVLTFHVEGLFRTPPGFNLWVGGPPNAMKDAIAPLGGVIETDWSPYSFTMNWRFTRPGQTIRFEENEPFCHFFPLERRLPERVAPRIRPIEDEPELKRQFETWSASRDAFQARMAADPPATPAEKWQKLYYRGVDADGAPGPADHKSKLRLTEFEGAALFHREAPQAPQAPPLTCPVGDPAEARQAWRMSKMEELRAITRLGSVPRKTAVSAEEFRDAHYAANWPVHIEGAVADWPAVSRWTPEYLKSVVGARPVQVQIERNADEDFERKMAAHAATLPFDAFIDRISRPGAGNDAYLTAYNSAQNEEALERLHGDLGFLSAYLSVDSSAPRGMLWIGPEGTFTPLHHDLTNNLLLQLVGRKEVLLVAPEETPRLYNDYHVYSQVRDLLEPDIVARFPKLDGVRVHRTILNPGDALFLPLTWWHQVRSLDFSVSVTHTNFHWPNDFHQSWPNR